MGSNDELINSLRVVIREEVRMAVDEAVGPAVQKAVDAAVGPAVDAAVDRAMDKAVNEVLLPQLQTVVDGPIEDLYQKYGRVHDSTKRYNWRLRQLETAAHTHD